ncbi:TPA: hypothetical protein PJG53_003225 [Escherichia coli]|nr:hypothetical protein [Escherichia coli]ELF2505676.1 hypothetical protein [Escherichia coli]MBB7334337.1 hypothetical protein [Escherichia coli]HBQ4767683.1 hypothetical protein [Escherichia coli]HDH7241338.1 hypothetical protein [Escherichia coli]HDW2917007.1 hypothetical protein [Escherichia coli]
MINQQGCTTLSSISLQTKPVTQGGQLFRHTAGSMPGPATGYPPGKPVQTNDLTR